MKREQVILLVVIIIILIVILVCVQRRKTKRSSGKERSSSPVRLSEGSHHGRVKTSERYLAKAIQTVSSTADSGPGSLRDAIATAASGDTILITAGGTITLLTSIQWTDKSLIIKGPGAKNLLISKPNGAQPAFGISVSNSNN
ncbi:MAG: hypothetical protein ACMG6E_10830, partial [Candidatus Roizmanbacteria bacterium]